MKILIVIGFGMFGMLLPEFLRMFSPHIKEISIPWGQNFWSALAFALVSAGIVFGY